MHSVQDVHFGTISPVPNVPVSTVVFLLVITNGV